MLNVVIITPGFPVDEQDSVCLPFLQLYINYLRKRDVHITVITEQYPPKESYTWNNIHVFTLWKQESKLSYKILKRYRLFKILRQLYNSNKMDVIHNLWFNETALLVNRFAKKNGTRHITTFPGQDARASNKALAHINKYHGPLVCVSQFQKMKLLENVKTTVEIIEWGIESIDHTGSSKTIDLIFCGWINSIKNYQQFVEIVYELNQKGLLKKVVVCGGGEQLAQLTEKVQAFDLQSLIELKGSIDRAEVILLMQQSKILVHTSHYESFGLVLAEALACNCTVISKPVGIAYDNADIVTCETTPEFVAAISHQLLLQDGDEVKHIQKTYDINRTVDQYLLLYTN